MVLCSIRLILVVLLGCLVLRVTPQAVPPSSTPVPAPGPSSPSSSAACAVLGPITGCGAPRDTSGVQIVVDPKSLVAPYETEPDVGYDCTETSCVTTDGEFVFLLGKAVQGWLFLDGAFACPSQCTSGPAVDAFVSSEFDSAKNALISYWDKGGKQDLCNAVITLGCKALGLGLKAAAPEFCGVLPCAAICSTLATEIAMRTASDCKAPPTGAPFVTTCSDFATVRENDTCTTIGEANGIQYEDLIYVNPGINCKYLEAGQKLCVTPDAVGPPPTNERCTTVYKVQEGNTCTCIAAIANITIDRLMELNSEIDEDCFNLQGGQNLCLFESEIPNGCSDFHTVEAGDTCEGIAAEADVGLDLFTDSLNSGICCPTPRIGAKVCTKSDTVGKPNDDRSLAYSPIIKILGLAITFGHIMVWHR